MRDPEEQKLILGACILRAWTDANGGKEPRTVWHYKKIARRFGVRIHWLPSDCDTQSLCRQGDRVGQHGVIYIRRTHDIDKLRREFLHELGEAATYWEGVPPFRCQLSRHEVACAGVASAALF